MKVAAVVSGDTLRLTSKRRQQQKVEPKKDVLSGVRFGRWVVLKEGQRRGYAIYWLCRCDCGVEREIYGNGLKAGASLSCGCLKADRTRQTAIEKSEVRAGGKWGRWTVLSDVPSRRFYRMCRCECGVEREVVLSALLSGRSRSCGCAQGKRQRTTRRQFSQHGMTGTPTWLSWIGMIQRCTDPNHESYKHYGGKDINVCERWKAFENFLADMGERPEGLTLDRKDGTRGYDPGNCRWATRTEQVLNRTGVEHRLGGTRRLLTHEGATLNMTEWAERQGVGRVTIFARLRRGWTTEEALGFVRRDNRHATRAS